MQEVFGRIQLVLVTLTSGSISHILSDGMKFKKVKWFANFCNNPQIQNTSRWCGINFQNNSSLGHVD